MMKIAHLALSVLTLILPISVNVSSVPGFSNVPLPVLESIEPGGAAYERAEDIYRTLYDPEYLNSFQDVNTNEVRPSFEVSFSEPLTYSALDLKSMLSDRMLTTSDLSYSFYLTVLMVDANPVGLVYIDANGSVTAYGKSTEDYLNQIINLESGSEILLGTPANDEYVISPNRKLVQPLNDEAKRVVGERAVDVPSFVSGIQTKIIHENSLNDERYQKALDAGEIQDGDLAIGGWNSSSSESGSNSQYPISVGVLIGVPLVTAGAIMCIVAKRKVVLKRSLS